MSDKIENNMLDALELFHYASKFRHSVFIICLGKGISVDDLIMDFKTLKESLIHFIILTQEQIVFEKKSKEWSALGLSFHFFNHPSDINLHRVLQEEIYPAIVKVEETNIQDLNSLYNTAFFLAEIHKAQKIFFLTNRRKVRLISREKEVKELRQSELKELIWQESKQNYSTEELILIESWLKNFDNEIVLLPGKPGALFQEIFTHSGFGTLISVNYTAHIRKGAPKDVMEVLLLMKLYIQRGILLPLEKYDVLACIEDFFLYTINHTIVACAMFIDYEEGVELAKFCTFPRYQGKGRAKELALNMIEEAKYLGKKYVFALSILPGMWGFFQELGFSEVERSSLPQSWQKNYNFERPSKAFLLPLIQN